MTPLDIIFDKDSFLPVFNQDINAAKKRFYCKSVRQKNAHASNDKTPESGNRKENPCSYRYPSEGRF
jgi:hypothetical protein